MALVTKTVKASGGDYSTLVSWEAGEQANLVTATNTHKVECDAFVDDSGATAFTLTGWTTNASYYVTIQGMGTIAMPFSTTATFTWQFSSTTAGRFNINQAYTRVYDIQIYTTGGSNTPFTLNQAGVVVDRVFVWVGTVLSYYGVRVGATAACTGTVSNVILRADSLNVIGGVSGFRTDNASTSMVLANCMVFVATGSSGSTNRGYFQSAGSLTGLNCVCFGFDYAGVDFYSGTYTYCATNQTEANSGLNGTTGAVFSITDSWTDSSTGDFRYTSFAALQEAGADASSYTTTDIVGTTRTLWDIGPYELDLTQSVSGGMVFGEGLVAPAGVRTTVSVAAAMLSASAQVISYTSFMGTQVVGASVARVLGYVKRAASVYLPPWQDRVDAEDGWQDATASGVWTDIPQTGAGWTDE